MKKFAVLVIILCLTAAFADATEWTGTWSTSVYSDGKLHNMPFENTTLRQVVRVSIPGDMIRLTFSNLFGETPLTIQKVHLAQATGGHSIDTSTDLKVTFNCSESVTIPAGGTVTSDILEYKLPALTHMAITIYFGSVPSRISGHVGSRTNSYYVSGDAVTAESLTEPAIKAHWWVIDRIDVFTEDAARAVSVYGDSITDGYGTTTGAQNRWTDHLATCLQKNEETKNVSVLNAGIGATGVIGSGTERLQRDILDQTDVGYVIIFYGVNDILFGRQSASQITAAYQTIIKGAHKINILVYGATITPFGGYSHYSDAKEVTRQEVNNWIKNTSAAEGGCDGVIDFDAVLRDPDDNKRLLKIYSNDWLHPSLAGYQKMAESVDLSLFSKTLEKCPDDSFMKTSVTP